MEKKITLTQPGREKLARELDELKTTKRPQVIDRIKRAKDFGDLSENAEYEDARNEQSFIEGRIQELEYILKNAEIVESGKKVDRVAMGSKVEVQMDKEKFSYEIVGSTEANPSEGKISSESPIGAVLLDQKVGAALCAQTPGGEVKIKILEIN